MPTWMFFVGLEAIISVVTAIITILWMRSGDEEDAYDIRLAELAKMNAERSASEN